MVKSLLFFPGRSIPACCKLPDILLSQAFNNLFTVLAMLLFYQDQLIQRLMNSENYSFLSLFVDFMIVAILLMAFS